jgi:hypothetical protein
VTMKDALAELEKWSRKYYRFEIRSSGHVQPGDGVQVVLDAGGRKVVVDEEELINSDNDYPLVGDIIIEAIRRWHTDDTVKNYVAYWSHKEDYPEFKPSSDIVWKWWTRDFGSWKDGVIQATLQARNEEEAIQKVKDGYAGFELKGVTIYERKHDS